MVWLKAQQSTEVAEWPNIGGLRYRTGSNPFSLDGQLSGAGGWAALKKQLFTDAGGFVENLRVNEDNELLLRLASVGPVAHVEQPRLLWRRVHTGQSSSESALRHQQSGELIFTRWMAGAYKGNLSSTEVDTAALQIALRNMLGHGDRNFAAFLLHVRLTLACYKRGVESPWKLATQLARVFRNFVRPRLARAEDINHPSSADTG
jgi:hypothetical protein